MTRSLSLQTPAAVKHVRDSTDDPLELFLPVTKRQSWLNPPTNKHSLS